ncbi:MAG: peptidylprolyl isomerase [Fidelibacterota bacterium]
MIGNISLIFLAVLLVVGCTSEEKVGVISTRFGDIIVEFYPDLAPKHVESFQTLAEEGYYNGTIFHRVIPGFVIQGGDPNTKGTNKALYGMGGHAGKYYGIGEEDNPETWMLPAEFNPTPHHRGILSMARSRDPNSAGSQFFICVANANQLDNQYTVFGNVIQGLDVVDRIVNLPRDQRDNPHERVEMTVKIVPRSSIKSLE